MQAGAGYGLSSAVIDLGFFLIKWSILLPHVRQQHPTDILKRTRTLKDWKSIVGERPSLPRRTKADSAPQHNEPTHQEEQSTEDEDSDDSEQEVEGALSPEPVDNEPSDPESEEGDDESDDDHGDSSEELFPGAMTQAHLARLCKEGGVPAINFLLSKAVSPTAMDISEKSPKEWTYRDIARLPELEREAWRTACNEELDALRRRKVFDLVERPRGRKVIKNRWVFDVKTDGRKKARLVAKGFSQVEGLDYDQVFSPVVRFETVRLI